MGWGHSRAYARATATDKDVHIQHNDLHAQAVLAINTKMSKFEADIAELMGELNMFEQFAVQGVVSVSPRRTACMERRPAIF